MDINEHFNTFPVINSEKLILRQAAISDSKAIFKILGDKSLLKYSDLPVLESILECEKAIEQIQEKYANKSEVVWVICKKENNELIGLCRFYNLNFKHRFASVGFELLKNHWGCGLINETMQATLNHLFVNLKINRIEAQVFPRNERAVKVLEKIGFQKEGFMRENFMIEGKLENSILFSLLEKDYFPNNELLIKTIE